MNKQHIRFGKTETAIPLNELFDVLGLDLYDVICLISTHTAMLYLREEQRYLIETIKNLFFTTNLPVITKHCHIIQILKTDQKTPVTEEFILETLRKEFQVEIGIVEALNA
jgi:hypothetical protein